MPQVSTFADIVRLDRSERVQYNVCSLRKSRWKRLFAASILLGLIVVAATNLRAQTPDANPSQSTTQSATDQTNGPTTTSSASEENTGENAAGPLPSGGPLATTSLSADQIINILQQDPEIVVELKTLAADRMQQQGVQVDANDISDEALYDQIATNAALRASITSFLRARGYVTAEDLEEARYAQSSGTADTQLPRSQFPQTSGATSSSRPSAAGAEMGAAQSGLPSALPPGMVPPTSPNIAQHPQRNERTNASTDVPKVLRQPAPYNLQSMRDLYTQIPQPAAALKRFGSDVFVNRDIYDTTRLSSARESVLDVPLGPDYVLGPGDTLVINMWGGVTQSITRVVDRDGRILLPEAGSLAVAGLRLDNAETLIGNALKQQYRNLQVAVTVSHVRSVRVYIVGDVQRPGGYDISALATPVSALYAAGGPTSVGSLRTLRHYRGQQLLEDIDLYDFLLNGIRGESARFQSGDTLLVPPAGPQVAVSGAVKRPAIYELRSGESTLAAVIEDSGGFTAAASLGHITIERIDANRQRETVTLNIAGNQSPQADRDAVATFLVRDGDRIRVDPILPYSERAIYLEGHVVRPGRLPYNDGMQLSDVLRSYQDMLPEPAAHGEIIRLVPPDLHAETIDFNVPDVLIGNANVNLQPFDTIRVFGRYETDAPKVTILGEVMRPGSYPLSKGMTSAQLVRMAGGFKRNALQSSADLTSYEIVNGNKVSENLSMVRIGAAVDGSDSNADVRLKPGDILTIHQITGWSDIGQSVTIEGQVRYPGSYGFRDGERLSSVLRRAGGLLSNSYPAGAVLVREQVRELEMKSRDELIRQIEANSASARLSPNLSGGNAAQTLQVIKTQEDQVLADLKSRPPSGRLVIHITADIDSWANTPADVELRRGDVLTVPKRPGFVLVTGQVYNATAITFAPGKSASWYLSRAGGTNSTANRKEIFIIRANGSVIGRHSGEWFDPDVLSIKLNPGDVVVVPQKIIGSSMFWRNLLTTAQFASSVAITAAVALQ